MDMRPHQSLKDIAVGWQNCRQSVGERRNVYCLSVRSSGTASESRVPSRVRCRPCSFHCFCLVSFRLCLTCPPPLQILFLHFHFHLANWQVQTSFLWIYPTSLPPSLC